MSDVHLNLARKWRAKSFSQIIGQDLAIRILKNSLYVGDYLPAYLLWGQRGSGKTSTARVFAAAVNCERLEGFHGDPKKNIVPCLECESCKAMLLGKHPDFIEIDAASHTGVDNIRNIIDAASLMPLLGRKKIYLIDEAHMLSKAAFNAFLKILEEPPATVLFMLATTDPEKIIDTVKSRCFQLFFRPVASQILSEHLVQICTHEGIEFEREALDLIVGESSGSVRDAINLLEQIRFACPSVSRERVLSVLGHVDEGRLLHLFEIVLSRTSAELIPYLEELDIRRYSVEHLWSRLAGFVRDAVWFKHGVEGTAIGSAGDNIKSIVKKASLKRLTRILERFYDQEPLFQKVTDKHLFFEILLLSLCASSDENAPPNSNAAAEACHAGPRLPHDEDDDEECEEEEDEEYEEEEACKSSVKKDDSSQKSKNEKWMELLDQIDKFEDPLLSSIFKQAQFIKFEAQESRVIVHFSKQFIFFSDWLDSSREKWAQVLSKVFGSGVELATEFCLENHVEKVLKPQCKVEVAAKSDHEEKASKKSQPVGRTNNFVYKKSGKSFSNSGVIPGNRIDVSDEACWQRANLVLRHFPGVVSEVL